MDEQTEAEPHLFFKVSTALKRVIGRDLITDDLVAVFELVKNGFDAKAQRVELVFEDDRLLIIDDGKGMSLDDIERKWLFVAYSAKRDGTEDDGYRDRIGASRTYAGSKGVGRFSCDRLGRLLKMQTRRSSEMVEVLDVDWQDFERDALEEFKDVGVAHSEATHFELPKGVDAPKSGTVLEISGLREPWTRDKLLRLRTALAKLINPFGQTNDRFEVIIRAEAEEKQDAIERRNWAGEGTALSVVNGPVANFIFDTLKDKTTHLEVWLSEDGKELHSVLTDRGAVIYEIQEPSEFPLLVGSSFRCNLYYLNRSAKATFARRMGMPSTQFGSVFLFKNGFRIFPIGEMGVDTFRIDRRKAQGYNRFLGTRDIIGRIDVSGSDEVFRESTSRDQGLIETPAYQQMDICFDTKCFRRLERYVVGVNWQDQLDLDVDDISRLQGDTAAARITAIVSQLAGTEGVKLVRYNHDLVRILNERSAAFKETLTSLEILARKANDPELLADIGAASKRFDELQRAEASAREAADRERDARREAERIAAEAQFRAEVSTSRLEEERKRNLFLTSLSSLDRETVEILHHQIVIHAAAINEIINGQFDRLRDGGVPTADDLFSVLENISFQNRKVLSIARFATKANFRLESETIDADIAGYIEDYICEVAPMFSEAGIRIIVSSSATKLERRFKPIEVAILVDNLVSNASRAEATEIKFTLAQPNPRELLVSVEDDGRGFPAELDLSRVYEKGFTTSTGSGLGLYHVAQILDGMRGAITAERRDRGAHFTIRIKG
ncbi:ATP-binding protein [Sphingobium yanoikuyae]|uniref:histidine kinase n=1 Tax=Sphingobium yanoikuyae TaxID=13690 RepID=A0A430BFH1_SPHYA|nr:ATP-binding protein [Sphingobium yanoikuyae]RSU48166.1 ATP-binding protein [Sphingobium yanoikuyae]